MYRICISFVFAIFIGNYFFYPLKAENFVVGTTSAYAPYVSLNEAGEYVGFDIDIALALSEKMNRKLVIKDLGSMPALFLALQQGKVDALIWAISITKDRTEQMEMIYYQGEKVTSLPLLFWKEIPSGVTCLESLAGDSKAVVCVEAGSFQESFLLKVPGLSLRQVDKVMDAIMQIRYGKAVATLIDPSLLSIVRGQYREIQTLEVPLPDDEQSFGNGICINKKNRQLRDEVQKAVTELQAEGKITQLEQKWNLGE